MEGRSRRATQATNPGESQTQVASGESADPTPVEQPVEETVTLAEPAAERSALPAPALPVRRSSAAVAEVSDFGREALAEAGTAFTRGIEALSAELAAITRHSIDMAARTAIETLAVKTWTDAGAIHTNLARESFDQWVDSSARMSELGIKLAVESTKPLIGHFDKIWSSAYRKP